MIELIIDKWELSEPDQTSIIVSNEKSYIKSRRSILENLSSKRKVKIYVRNAMISDWYKDLKEIDSIIWTELDPRKELKKKV